MRIITVLFLVLCLCIPTLVLAETSNSCTKADVLLAYNATAVNGTLIIPQCNSGELWAATDYINVEKAINIVGNGSTGDSKTKLVATADRVNGFFKISTNATDIVSISGIYFDLTEPSTSERVAISITGSPTQLKIFNNYFYGGKYQIWRVPPSSAYGVIYSNTFHNSMSSIAIEGNGSASWTTTISAGANIGLNTLYIENNRFIRDNAIGCDGMQNHIESSQGGSFTIRYNTFDGDGYCSTQDISDRHILTHGNGDCNYETTGKRGHPVIEIYNNKFTAARLDYIQFRGGSVLMHSNNIISGKYTTAILLREEEADTELDACRKVEWPAADQIFNSFFWANTANSNDVIPSIYLIRNSACTSDDTPYHCCEGLGTGHCDDFIKVNRDYFNREPQDSGGKETLYESSGVSYTYHSNGQMTFSESGPNAYYPYNAYTCPHPLTGLTGSCATTGGTMYGTTGYNIESATQYALSITATNCTVTSSPAGINCGATCTYDYDENTEVTLSPTCSAGYQTPAYSGDCSTATITMTAAKNCTVACSAIPISNSGCSFSGGGMVR